MADWPTKEELLVEARVREQLGHERNLTGGRKTEPKPREYPHRHELTPGDVFAIGYFPSTVEGVDPSVKLPWRERWAVRRIKSYFEYPDGNRGGMGFLYTYEKAWRVRIVCSPGKNSNICLVERCCDGKLGVVDIDRIKFCWSMKELK
jgi:hypothetical protein